MVSALHMASNVAQLAREIQTARLSVCAQCSGPAGAEGRRVR